jgi:hypothetical protein
MVDFMSPATFNAGGPQPSAVGGAAGGFGQLADVLAKGPMMHAQASYYGAQTDKARAETQGLTQAQGVAQGRAERAKEAMGLLSDPTIVNDPQRLAQVISRVTAIGMADPDLAPNMNAMLGGWLSRAGMSNAIMRREADAANAGTPGGPSYASTQTGAREAEAATTGRTVLTEAGATGRTAMTEAGANLRDSQQLVSARLPGQDTSTPPITMSKADAFKRGATVISATQQDREATPMPVVPAGSDPSVQPTLFPGGAVAAAPGAYTGVGAAQQAASVAPTTVLTRGGPALQATGAATAQNAQPVLGSADSVLAGAYQQQVFPGGAPSGAFSTPVTLPPAPGTVQPGTTPQPPATTPQPEQPPATTPTEAPPGSPLATALALRPMPSQSLTPVTSAAQEGLNMNALLDKLATEHYPAGTGMTGGIAGTLGPEARAKIIALTNKYMTSGPERGRADAAMERSIRELQATGELAPDKVQGAQLGRSLGSIFSTPRNIKELQKPAPKTSTTSTTKTATTPQMQPGSLHDYKGRQIGLFDNKWFFVGPNNEPTEPVPGT